MGLPVASATFVRIEGTPCGNVLGAVCNIKKMLPVALSKLEKRLQEASKTGLFAKCHWDADWEIESGEHGLRFTNPAFDQSIQFGPRRSWSRSIHFPAM